MLTSSALALTLLAGGVVSTSAATTDNAAITRGEYVKSIIEALDVELGSGETVKFKDVPDSLKPYIEKAIELKLITGKNATTFGTNDKLTRSHAMLILGRGIETDQDSTANLLKYNDVKKISKAYYSDIAKVINLGVVKGYATDNTLRPGNNVTKAQTKLMVERFLKEYKPAQANSTVSLQILGTTDIHTNVVNYDYYKDSVSNTLGLAKTATLINEARKNNPNTLLFDNGDSIQGTPLGSYMFSVKGLKDGEVHPSVAAMEALNYDGATLGNHEFNYGLPFLDEVIDDSSFPYLNANVRDAVTKELLYKPYAIIEKEVVDSNGKTQTIKVGVTGIVPPQILKWDKVLLEGKVVVDDAVNAVKNVVPQLEAEGADVVVVLAHSGFGDATHEEGEEDVTYLLTAIEGVDAVISGHAHDTFPRKDIKLGVPAETVDLEKGTMNGTPIVMPGKYGSHLGVIDLQLEKVNGKWEVGTGTAKINGITADTAVDEKVVAAVKNAHEGTIQYVRQAVGETTATIHSYFAQVLDDPSIQIVTDAQRVYVEKQLKGTAYENLPILSAGAPFKAGTRSDPEYYTYVAAGQLAIKNVADLYLYDNTLAILKVTGADVKEWLEMSAGQFNRIDPNSKEEQQLINQDYRSYNYDVIDGVTYQFDVTQPAKYSASGALVNADASRVVNLQYNGKPIDLTQEFIVATNNYRASGTFPGVRAATATEIFPDENRQAIIDYILERKTIDPTADGNWSFTELPESVNVVFESSPNAQKVLTGSERIKYIGEGTDGFGKYSLSGK